MEQNIEELIQAFHLTWDLFPEAARIIDRKNEIIAANPKAIEAGFIPGQICSKTGSPQSHRGCKKMTALKTGLAQTDQVIPGRIRGWFPVEGYPDLVIHFSLAVPEKFLQEN